MATIQYARLYPDALQLQAKNGTNLTAGWVLVFLAGTDDPATTYADFNGTVNPQKIVIDDNGRFCAIVDKAKAYRVEVYDSEGMLQWTTEPVWCTGNAGSGMSVTEVVSTNGSISVDKSTVGSVTTYDIGIAPSDSDEFLEWIKCSEEDCDATWKPVYQSGTMETEAGQGIKVHGGHLYHFTNTFTVDPDGTGINYDTFSVNMYCGNQVVDSRNFDIDTSVNDSVMCEFSYDLVPEEDSFVYFTLTIPSTCEVTGEVQCHRIYSGINAVPDTCATQQWVRGYFDFNMSAHIPYSALEYNANNAISGISGSAIAGNLNSAQVSAIASSYAESAVSSLSGSISSKLDASASSMFQPSGNYYSATNPSGFITTADMSGYAKESALSSKLDASASSMFQPSGYYQPSGDYYSASNPSGFITTADLSSFAKESSLSSKLDASASSEFYSTSNPSGFLTAHQSLSGYATEAYVDSSVSSKLDTTAFSMVSGDFLTSHQSLAGYATESYVDSAVSGKLDVTASSQFLTGLPDDIAYTSDVASAVSGKLDSSASSSFYPMTGNPSGFLTAHQSLAGLATETYVDSSVSSKLDISAYDSAEFYSTANPSGFIGSAYVDSAVSGKMDSSASSDFVQSASMSAWIPYSALDYSGTAISGIGGSSLAGMGGGDYTGVAPVIVDNDNRTISVDHKTLCVDETMTAYNSGSSAVIGVNTATVLSGLGDYQLTADMTAYQLSGDYQTAGNYLSATESSNYYPSSNPSGFITGIDLTNYATTSYVDSSVSSKADSSAVWNMVTSKMDSSAVQSAYASASATDATAQNVLYILIPDGV